MAIICPKCDMRIWGKDQDDCLKLLTIHKRSCNGKRPDSKT